MIATTRRQFLIGLLAIILLSIFDAAYWERKPSYNWDMLAYIAVALIDTGVPPFKVHDLTYQSLFSVPEQARQALVEDGGYRTHVAQDAERFMDQLPFYSVKPVYPWLVSLLYRAGIELPRATVIVSATAYAGIPVLLFLWLSEFGCAGLAAPLAGALALTPLVPSGQGSGPDTLSELVVLTGLYFGFQKERQPVALAVLLFSITVRPENIIFALGYACYAALARKLSLKSFTVYCGTGLAVIYALSRLSGNYGWTTLMYYAFVNYDIDVKHFISPLKVRDYALIYAHGLNEMFFTRQNGFAVATMLAFGGLGITTVRAAWQNRFFHMILLAVICALARFVNLPQHFERAFGIPYVMLTIAFIYFCCELLRTPALTRCTAHRTQS